MSIYGLDVYSFFRSTDAAIRALERVDAGAAGRARERYACFARFRNDPEAYAVGASEPGASCERQAREQVEDIRDLQQQSASRRSADESDALFDALHNARAVKGAEEFFRSQYRGSTSSWNLRDRHMADTLDELARHHRAQGRSAKFVVWAHNSHVGDARATEQGAGGEWNIGQLVRQRHKRASVLVGFSTYTGTVTAASDWDRPGVRMRVRPAIRGSYGAIFHAARPRDFLLVLRGNRRLAAALATQRLERAIGVIYVPETERASHYFGARLSRQFDAVVHVDKTRAVVPLPRP